MPAPATIADFLGLVSRSGLLEQQELEGYLSRLRQASRLPGQPGSLAAQLVSDGLLTNFQADLLLNGRCKGFLLSKYKLLDRLGAGGMGTVFLAEHLRMQRPVALKVLPSERANDPACRGRFLREAQAVAALDHPNIVRAYDIETEGATCFLVMEYVDGVNLQELVTRRGPLTPERAAHYIQQAALGLEHAHQAGLIHRDIKPANLLVTRSGVLKILDMGLARFFQDDSDTLTREHDGKAILGTADYLAPEQGRDSHEVDIRADIYSLGATFFYLLLGRPPFDGGTLNQKLIWHQIKAPPDVHSLRREVSTEMAALVAAMLAKQPGQRPQTPAEVAAALMPWTQTPLAPPTADELPERRPAVYGPRSGRFAESSIALFPAPDTSLTGSAATRTTELDLASASRPTSTLPAVSPSRLAAERGQRHPARHFSRRWYWYGTGFLLLSLIAGGAIGVLVRHTDPPAPSAIVAARAPTNVRVAMREAGGIDLKWETVADPDVIYKIERAADRAFATERVVLASLTADATQWTDATAPKGKANYYRIVAVDETGESAVSNVAWPPPAFGDGFTPEGMVLNGGAALVGKTLRLTDGGANEARSAFYPLPLDVRSFVTRFRFQIGAGNTSDGFTFCIQGINPRRVGAAAGGLGYEGIGLSVALKFDLWDNEGEGPNSTGLFTGGMKPDNPSVDLTPRGIDLHSGRVYDVELSYRERVLHVTIRDVAEPTKVFRRRFPVDLAAEVQESTAYMGFTAGTGGVGAVQDILNWTWVPGDPESRR